MATPGGTVRQTRNQTDPPLSVFFVPLYLLIWYIYARAKYVQNQHIYQHHLTPFGLRFPP